MGIIFKTHLKKQWTGFLTTFLFIVLAAIMLTVGISINSRSKTMLEEKISKSNTATDMCIIGVWDKPFARFIENKFKENENIKDLTKSYEFSLPINVKGREKKADNEYYVLKYDPDKGISRREPYESDSGIEGGVYVNTCFKERLGVKIGDVLEIFTPNGFIERRVNGYYEEYTILWSPMVMLEAGDFDAINAYVGNQTSPEPPIVLPGLPMPEQQETAPADELRIWRATLLEFNVSDRNELQHFYNELTDDYFAPLIATGRNVNLNSWNISDTHLQLMSFANILSAMLIVFAFVITGVSLIIIRFIIVSNMEDDIKNIGILKSLGYTTTNLRVDIFAEYLAVALAAAITGALISIAALPLFTNIIGMTVYLEWHAKITAVGAVCGALVPPILVSLTVWLITLKYKKVTPVVALRKGLGSSKVKKNRMPLKKFDKAPNLTLSIKSVLNGGAKWISIGVVMLVVSFFAVFTYMLHYNINVDNSTFVGLTGNQPADVCVYTNRADIIEELRAIPEIEYIAESGYASGSARFEINGAVANSNYKFYRDFDKSKLDVLYKGSYPHSPDEIALTGPLASVLGVGIGDTVPVNVLGVVADFKITGLCQNMSSGYYCYTTGEGYLRLQPENATLMPLYTEFMAFAKAGTDIDALYDKVSALSAGKTLSEREYFGAQDKESNAKAYISDSIMDGSKILTYAMDGIAVISVFIILLFIIRLKLIREKSNIALSKALGVTAFGVMTQLCTGIVAVIGFSSVSGALLGALLSEKLLALALRGFGIMRLRLLVPWGEVALIAFAITAFAYLVSMLLSLATKKISPRSLLSD